MMSTIWLLGILRWLSVTFRETPGITIKGINRCYKMIDKQRYNTTFSETTGNVVNWTGY